MATEITCDREQRPIPSYATLQVLYHNQRQLLRTPIRALELCASRSSPLYPHIADSVLVLHVSCSHLPVRSFVILAKDTHCRYRTSRALRHAQQQTPRPERPVPRNSSTATLVPCPARRSCSGPPYPKAVAAPRRATAVSCPWGRESPLRLGSFATCGRPPPALIAACAATCCTIPRPGCGA